MGIIKKRLLFLNSISEELKDYSNKIESHCIPLIKTSSNKINPKDYDTKIPWVITSQSAAKVITEFPKLSDKIYLGKNFFAVLGTQNLVGCNSTIKQSQFVRV